MSRFFKETQKANGGAAQQHGPRGNHVPDVEKLLETIHQGVDEQFAGIESPSSVAPLLPVSMPLPAPQHKLEAVLDAAQSESMAACGVAEFSTEKYRRIPMSRSAERVFYPERETNPAPPAWEAYRTFRTRLLRLQARRHFRTVVISSATPGDGKTLTSINLALCCAQLPHFPLLVIDGDLRTQGVSRLVGHDGCPGVAEVLDGRLAPEAAVLATDVPNLHVMPAGTGTQSPPELLSGAPWEQLVGWCKKNFKLIIVDSPPVLPLADFDLISAACESVLLVLRARATDREAFQKIVAHVDHAKLLGVTLNSVERSAGRTDEYYYYPARRR